MSDLALELLEKVSVAEEAHVVSRASSSNNNNSGGDGGGGSNSSTIVPGKAVLGEEGNAG